MIVRFSSDEIHIQICVHLSKESFVIIYSRNRSFSYNLMKSFEYSQYLLIIYNRKFFNKVRTFAILNPKSIDSASSLQKLKAEYFFSSFEF